MAYPAGIADIQVDPDVSVSLLELLIDDSGTATDR